MSHEHSDSCCKHTASSSVCQDLEEMDFERGIGTADTTLSALNGETERLQTMLNKGTDPSEPDRYGFTALHYAARNKARKKANVTAELKFAATQLHGAAYRGYANICQIMLDYKVDPSQSDSDGKTALHKAAEQGHLNVAKVLVQKDKHLKCVKDKYSRVPQDYVDPKKHEELYNLLAYVKDDFDCKNVIS